MVDWGAIGGFGGGLTDGVVCCSAIGSISRNNIEMFFVAVFADSGAANLPVATETKETSNKNKQFLN